MSKFLNNLKQQFGDQSPRSTIIVNTALFFGLGLWLLLTFAGTNLQRDFIQDYYAGLALLNSQSIYDPQIAVSIQRDFGFIIDNYHPPTLILLTAPLAFLSYSQALAIVSAILLGLYLTLVNSSLRLAAIPEVLRRPVFAIALLWVPYLNGIFQGNLSAHIACLLALIFFILHTAYFRASIKRELCCGALLGLLCLLKLYPFYLIGYFLLRRKYIVVASSILSSVAFATFTYLVIGQQDIILYFNVIAPSCFANFNSHFANISLSGMIMPWFSGEGIIKPLVSATFGARLAVIILSSAIVVSTCCLTYLCRSKILKISDEFLLFSLWLNGMILLSPISWQFSLLSLLPQVIILAKSYWSKEQSRQLIILIGCFIFSFIANYDGAYTLSLKSEDQSIDYLSFMFLTKFQSLALIGISGLLVVECLKSLKFQSPSA